MLNFKRLPHLQHLLVFMMLIAFIGQAFADTTSACDMEKNHQHDVAEITHTNDSHPHMDHASMDHSSMKHAAMNHDNTDTSTSAETNCCGENCTCPISACASMAYLAQYIQTIKLSLYQQASSNVPSAQPTYFASSLYRPPIFA